MLLRTYEYILDLFKLHNYYMSYDMLRCDGVTITQINELVARGDLKKLSRGWYWWDSNDKVENFEVVELTLINPDIIICNDSAAYYYGLISKKPECVSYATRRSDRKNMDIYFNTRRHYFSDASFEDNIVICKTDIVDIRYTSIDKTVCDCIRFDKEIGEEKVHIIVDSYMGMERKSMERLRYYANHMRVGRHMENYLN